MPLCKDLKSLALPLFLAFLLLLLVVDICPEDVLVQSDGADAVASRPAM
jgi:hypothetical protein